MIQFRYMTRDELNDLSIFALREFARRTGVYAPTSKKKDELINEIIEISEGRKQPHIAKTKQGRPPKNYGYPFADTFIGMPQQVFPTTLKQDSHFVYTENLKSVAGYVEVTNGTAVVWAFINLKMVCFNFAKNLAENYGLRTGDFVQVSLGGENNNQVTEILAINNLPIQSFNPMRMMFNQIEHQPNFEPIAFNQGFENVNICKGESVYLYGANNMQNSLAVASLLTACHADVKIYLNISIVDKNRFVLNSLADCEEFVINFAETIDDARRAVVLAIERAKRALENGQNCVLAIDDVQSVHSIDDENKTLTKSLMSLSKAGQNGSVTLLALMPQNRSLDFLEKLADRRYKIIDRNLVAVE